MVGDRAFKLHGFFLTSISSIGLDAQNVVINVSDKIPKSTFIQYIGENLDKPDGTYSIGSGMKSGDLTIAGNINPKEITAQSEVIDA